MPLFTSLLYAALNRVFKTQLSSQGSASLRHNRAVSRHQESTVRVIWAYHQEDVGEAGPKYHNSNRGTKSLRLLNPEKTSVWSTSTPYFDLVNQDVSFSVFHDCRGGIIESV